jgi:predicted transcriptional regulator of viral defense system
MTIIELVRLMQKLAREHDKRVFTLREMASLRGEPRTGTAMTLLRAAGKGIVGRAGKLWLNLLDPPELLEVALSLLSPSYMSFESALHRHGVISQAPLGALTMATTRRPRLVETPLGAVRFFHLKSELFFGFDDRRIALPEKAWLDLLYIRGLRGRKNLITEKVYFENLDPKAVRNTARQFPRWVGNLSNENLE